MVAEADIVSNVMAGVNYALSHQGIFYCFLGVTIGMAVGVLPGIGVLSAIALLMPLTFYVEPGVAIIMLAGIYYGAAYGGSTASILLNLPGTPSTAVTCLDGHPMAKQGRAGIALFITTIASFVGSLIGIVILAAFSIPLSRAALSFGPQEYFSLMVLGLMAAALMSSLAPFKSLAMVVLGVIMGLVGVDLYTGVIRFSFGLQSVYEGLPLVAVALGLFGLPEIIRNVGDHTPRNFAARDITFKSMIPTREDWRRSRGAMARGAGIGSFLGALPGTGGMIASFMSYAVEKRKHKHPEQFGKGAIEGVAGPETANNAAVQTAFIPTLTLGIPGDAVMALMLGVLIMHGVAPGPEFMNTQPDIFWGLIVSFLLGNFILLFLNIPLIGLWVRLLSIPNTILTPIIICFICIGVYSIKNSSGDIYLLAAFALMGYLMLLLNFPVAQFVLGLILGPLMEEYYMRSMILSQGDVATFVVRPISATILALTFLVIAWAALQPLRKRYMR